MPVGRRGEELEEVVFQLSFDFWSPGYEPQPYLAKYRKFQLSFDFWTASCTSCTLRY